MYVYVYIIYVYNSRVNNLHKIQPKYFRIFIWIFRTLISRIPYRRCSTIVYLDFLNNYIQKLRVKQLISYVIKKSQKLNLIYCSNYHISILRFLIDVVLCISCFYIGFYSKILTSHQLNLFLYGQYFLCFLYNRSWI